MSSMFRISRTVSSGPVAVCPPCLTLVLSQLPSLPLSAGRLTICHLSNQHPGEGATSQALQVP